MMPYLIFGNDGYKRLPPKEIQHRQSWRRLIWRRQAARQATPCVSCFFVIIIFSRHHIYQTQPPSTTWGWVPPLQQSARGRWWRSRPEQHWTGSTRLLSGYVSLSIGSQFGYVCRLGHQVTDINWANTFGRQVSLVWGSDGLFPAVLVPRCE